MNIPKRIQLANLPTPIFPLSYKKDEFKDVNIFIKRDDYTGIEVSGNKIRKLEFSLKDALDKNAKVLITCGGIQSNHCRATASVAAAYGLKSHLLLRYDKKQVEGNYFLDKLFGANFTFITEKEYKYNRSELMENIKKEYELKGEEAYIIPEGASNGIGMFGYYNAFLEILDQEKSMGINFDTICLTEGSGGTYSGLYFANEILKTKKKIVAFNIYDKNADVKSEIAKIIDDGLKISSCDETINYDNIIVNPDYAGEGYGIAYKEVIDFIKNFARKTGIILDPVYTGKSLYGMYSEIENKNQNFVGNILFIHTGGLFGLFAKKDLFFDSLYD